MTTFPTFRLSSKTEHADMPAAGHADARNSAAAGSEDSIKTQEILATASMSERLLMGAILVLSSLVCVYAFMQILPMLLAHGKAG